MWNAHFASRDSIAADGPANANGVTSDFAIAEFNNALSALRSRIANNEFGPSPLSATIIKRDDNMIVTMVTATIEVQGEAEPIPVPVENPKSE